MQACKGSLSSSLTPFLPIMKTKKSIDTYLSEIVQEKRLSDVEEKQLAERIQQGDQHALAELTTANLTYVVALAHQYAGNGLPEEDLISEGNIGMMRAAAKFDASRGKRFVTFAAPYIREAMRRAIDQQAGLYRVPTDAADTALERRRSRALSIDAPVGGSQDLSLGRVMANPHAIDPSRLMEQQALVDELSHLVTLLDEREREVATSLYGLDGTPLTMAETAERMGLKRERVRQIRNKAVRRLCRMTHNIDLRNYLSL